MPCRINNRRLWTARLVLEGMHHAASCFATLTYGDRFRVTTQPGNLLPRDLQLFQKRLRKSVARPLRFYGVGEYGEKNFRPHYHVMIYGLGLDNVRWNVRGHVCGGEVFDAWGLGQVHIGELTIQSAHYVGGYITKKMTARDDPRLQKWMHPEFARMSNRPGIGHKAMAAIAANLTKHGGAAALAGNDVPFEVRVDGKRYPLGRYLRRTLREAVGWKPDMPADLEYRVRLREAFMPDQERWDREKRRAQVEEAANAQARIKRSTRTL